MRFILLILSFCMTVVSCHSQGNAKSVSETGAKTAMSAAATKFLKSLTGNQRSKAQFQFEEEERFNWHFVPKSRKGISLKELNGLQRTAAMDLLHTAVSDTGFEKTNGIIQLEDILRVTEGRPENDDYRDFNKYYISIFGDPSDVIWGWRLEGHHISLNFSSKDDRIVSSTPNFFGANPAVVLSGPEKGKQILKDETAVGFELLNALDEQQKKKAMIATQAPADIITGASRKAIINDTNGISYDELNTAQKKVFMQLLSVYVHRYSQLFAADMINEITTAGLNNLRFAWAGAQRPGLGNAHYYRILGPTIIIEYDNTQNNANHVHTVVRDLKNDFGGDQLLQHYQNIKH